MSIDPKSLTREQIRDLIQRQRAGYEQMERDRLREIWREPTLKEKDNFSDLMQDVWELHKREGRDEFDSRLLPESELIAFYRKLLRLPHE